MLRQKSTLKFSYRFIKSLNSSNIRNLHLTYCVRLRRVVSTKKTLPDSKSNPHVQTVAGEFHTPENVSTNNNFYGIENDDGVIYVGEGSDKNSNKYIQKSFTNQEKIESIEKIKNTTFGKIRWDEENKPKFHGEYENSSFEGMEYTPKNLQNIVRRYAITEETNVTDTSTNDFKSGQFTSSNLGLKNYATEIFDERALKRTTLRVTQSVSNNPSKDHMNDLHISSQIMRNTNILQTANKEKKDNGFIDELYFHDQVHENNNYNLASNNFSAPKEMCENDLQQKTVQSFNATIKDKSDVIRGFSNDTIGDDKGDSLPENLAVNETNASAIDKIYFGNKLGSVDSPIPETSTPYKSKQNVSFFDESYFGEKLSINNSIVPKSTTINSSETSVSFPHEINFNDKVIRDDDAIPGSSGVSSNRKNTSFIDENYFSNLSDVDNLKIINENASLPENNVTNFSSVNLSENVGFQNKAFSEDIQMNKIRDENYGKNNLNYDRGKFSSQSGRVFNPEQHVKVLDVDYPQSSLNPETNSYKVQRESDKHFSSTSNFFKHQNPNLSDQKLQILKEENLLNEKFAPKKTLKTNFSDTLQQNETKSTGTVSKDDNSLGKSHIKQTVVKKTDGTDQETDIETAFDFVSKLRKEKNEVQPKIKGGKILPGEEKFDNKGFRILTNQVPNLNYFTREEILMLLKNNVLYSDDDLVVLNKPYNMVMHESKTTTDSCLSQYLDELATELDPQSENPKLFNVHRIDKETCGCLLLARNEIAADRLKSLFLQRKIIKTYWIVTIAVPNPEEGVIDIPIAEGTVDKRNRMVLSPKIPSETAYASHAKHGKRAVTRYRVVATAGNAALVEVQPETGLKHQIRVHFGFGLLCPILGDHKYSHLTKLVPQKLPSDMLQRLHVRQSKVRHIPMHIYARSILIPQYNEGGNLYVMAPMPTHMSINLQRLKFKKHQRKSVYS